MVGVHAWLLQKQGSKPGTNTLFTMQFKNTFNKHEPYCLAITNHEMEEIPTMENVPK